MFSLQKMLMQKRKRQVNGVPFDPTPEEDILWADEYSSADYDSDDIHSEVGSYCTDNDTTDDEEEGWGRNTISVPPVENVQEAMEKEQRLPDSDSESETIASCSGMF